jgi:hypothetical protein
MKNPTLMIGNLAYIKTTIWMILIVGILAAIAFVVYEMRKAGTGIVDTITSIKNKIFPPDPVMAPELQKFVDEAVNQPGGYTPWTPTTEEDESYPPSWLSK